MCSLCHWDYLATHFSLSLGHELTFVDHTAEHIVTGYVHDPVCSTINVADIVTYSCHTYALDLAAGFSNVSVSLLSPL